MAKIAVLLSTLCLWALTTLGQNRADALEYTININITDMSGASISGHTDILMKALAGNTGVVCLDLQNLELDSVGCDRSAVEYTYNDTLLTITLSTPPATDSLFTLHVKYHGTPQRDPSGWGGFYFSNDYAFNMGAAFDDIPHNYGRAWFPCNDNFTDKAKYRTIVTTRNDHKAVCAGTLMSVTDNDENHTKTYEWYCDKEIPTYLASVAVGNYLYINKLHHGLERDIPVDWYVYPGDSLKTMNSFANIDTAIAVFEDKFGAYPWDRIGYVAVDFNGGAMEHVTNIAMGRAFINGTTDYEELFYHELSHSWFGNLVTCQTAADMWLNEGWAAYCETLFREFVHGKAKAKKSRNAVLERALRYNHIEDDGFRAISPMDDHYTYSQTVYQNGACAVHALRGYLGDDIFFDAIKHYLQNFAYKNATSYDLRNFLSDYTNVDLTDFFDNHVFTPGFAHYSIDSTHIDENPDGNYNVTVFMKQKLRGRNRFSNSNKVEITFMDSSYHADTEVVTFDGETGSQTFTLPFRPALALCDFDDKCCDATIDVDKFVTKTGLVSFPYTYFSMKVKNIADNDSAFVRITHNWAAPDTLQTPIPHLHIANHRFWTVDGLFPPDFVARGDFAYNIATNASGYVDNEFIADVADSLVLLYRSNRASDWRILQADNRRSTKKIVVDTLKKGEYALAIFDASGTTGMPKADEANAMTVYPNPGRGDFTIDFGQPISGNIAIFDNMGKMLLSENVHGSTLHLDLSYYASGIYHIKFTDAVRELVYQKKIMIRDDE